MSNAHDSVGLEEHAGTGHNSSERRRSGRFALLIQAAKLVTESHEYLCIVRDASVDGLKIRHFGQFADCGHLKVELANGEAFPVELVWMDETYAGLQFNDPVDLSRIVSLSNGELPKRKLRLKTEAPADVGWEDRIAPAIVRNLSQQGAAIECRELMSKDQMIRLDIHGLSSLFAKVRWRRGTEYGLVFETTLSFEELAAAIVKLNS